MSVRRKSCDNFLCCGFNLNFLGPSTIHSYLESMYKRAMPVRAYTALTFYSLQLYRLLEMF